MIFTERQITIRNGKSAINKPVILYRGDYEVSIKFTIMESEFKFKNGINLAVSEKATHGQLAILAPYGGNVFSEIVKCEDGTVTFTLTKEMIDQLEEVGLYSFQIRLFDYYRESRVSIPPVEFGIEVREPVASEDHDNEVNNAIVGYSIAKVVDGLNEDVGDTFDNNGQYNKTDWETGDRITEGKLNKIEDALDKINQNEITDVAALDKRVTNNFNVLKDEFTSQLAHKAKQSDLEVERARIDAFCALEEGSTTGDAELIDARIGTDGVIYSNLGSSIRMQISRIDSNIESYIGQSLKYIYGWINGGYIDNTNGKVVEYDNWKYTDFIKIGDNIKALGIYTTLSGSYGYNAFYDINKEFICNFRVDSSVVDIPTNAVYFRISSTIDATTAITNIVEPLSEKCNEKQVREVSKELKEDLIDEYLGVKLEYEYEWIDGGYIDNINGNLVSYDTWLYTDYIELDEVNQLEVSTTLTGSYSYNAFYDVNKLFIKSMNVSNNIIDIPSNAKYMRLSVNKGSITNVKNKIEKLIEKCTIEEVKELIGGSGVADIIILNRDIEPFVIQASEGLGQMFTDKTKPLVFTHFSDIHTRQELWNRIIEYNNHYSDYLKFSIHTGDYCGGNRLAYIDLYANGKPCAIPIFNCVGNHDTYLSDNSKGDKKTTHDLLFNHSIDWNAVFMDIDNSMAYYKDFAEEKIRFIVLDYYYDIDEQCAWLLERLNGAKNLGYHVITCMHEMTNVITNKLDTTFQTIDDFESLGGNKYSISKFDRVIGDWIKEGGVHVANFAGHEHSDFIGYTENGVLNVCVQSATENIIWTDGKRVQGTRTWDCFNVVAVDVATNNLKLIRVGNNSDHYLREKKILSYDYCNKKIISN